MTPFFKCLGYPKVTCVTATQQNSIADSLQTKPSQMLDKNPGLRDITPSITGGSVSAQGMTEHRDTAPDKSSLRIKAQG